MKNVRSLSAKLKPLLNWHQSRIDCLAHLMINIILSGSVNLATLAEFMDGNAKASSHHKRLKRFFRHHDFCLDKIARLIVAWLAPTSEWVLCLDRTNWKIGQKHINILMLGIAINRISLPVVWLLLPSAGNSNTQQRISLVNRFVNLFGTERIAYITADREFKGREWLKWLKNKGIHWRIRIPNNTKVYNHSRNKQYRITRLFCLTINESMHLRQAKYVWGVRVYISAYRSAQEHIIIISDENVKTTLNDYMIRWSIETLFQSFKGRGFNLEDTRLSEEDRMKRLLAVLALTFCWSFETGIYRNEKEPIKVLKHGRLSMSLFRYGLSLLRHNLSSTTNRWCKQATSLINRLGKSIDAKQLFVT